MNDKAQSRYRVERNPEFGFYQVRPTPSAEEITRFYADEFYSSQYPGFNNSALDVQLADQDFHGAHRDDICNAIEQISGRSIRDQRILDVGCGWAQTLLYFKGKGANCYGFDPAPEAVAYAQREGLTVKQAGMENLEVFPGETFDVVTLLNVLEHLADPVSVMKEIRQKVLRPGGILVVEVPNDFNAFQLCGQRVHGLEEWWVAPPAHLNYFNNDSLRALLSGTGYEVQLSEASFPLEMFLLFGDNYVADKSLGRQCHERRMAFERNLRKQGFDEVLRRFYRSLAEQNLGRQIAVYARAG
jgi:2-polyprenyl-3-methyl-5-hydroxy-6-metoxy-1,4-benzoquinol methylase